MQEIAIGYHSLTKNTSTFLKKIMEWIQDLFSTQEKKPSIHAANFKATATITTIMINDMGNTVCALR